MTLGANAVAAIIVFAAYVIREDSTVAFAAYVVYSVAFELVMLTFWTFVSQHFNVLESKRIFPVIAAGSSIGYILAGVTTTVVAVYATEPLIFVWAFGSIAAAIMSRSLERTLFRPAFVDDPDEFFADQEAALKKHGVVAVLKGAFRYVTGSRLVLALILLALTLQVASRIGDYLVAVLFVQATHNNLQSLTILIGNAWLASYVVQLLVSLFVTPWILNKLGVKNALMALPLFTLVGFTAVAVAPVLSTALFLFIVRNGLQTGLDDPVENVLGNALPAQVGPKLKLLLDNGVLPGAAVLTGVGLLVVQRTIAAGVETLAILGVAVGILFILSALWVRSLYVTAIYDRLRTHALSLADFQQALGRPNPEQIAELQGYIRSDDDKIRQFATAALGKSAPEAFSAMLPELLAGDDRVLRRLALQMAPPASVTVDQLKAAAQDSDGWVRAAAAVAGATRGWETADELLRDLWESNLAEDRAAAVWAAAIVGGVERIVAAMGDGDSRVRLEAIRSFAKMKGDVAGISDPLIACLRDNNIEVRREAMRQAVRWTPPLDQHQAYAEALADGLASGDRDVRRLAAEAMAAQSPDALVLTLPLLAAQDQAAAAIIEALIRSGRPELFQRARGQTGMSDILDLGGRVALVTGAGQGVGRQIALHLGGRQASGGRGQRLCAGARRGGGRGDPRRWRQGRRAAGRRLRPRSSQGHGGQGEGGAGADRGPGQQRRQRRGQSLGRARQAVLGNRPGGLEQLHRRQLLRRHQLHGRRHSRHDRRARRPDGSSPSFPTPAAGATPGWRSTPGPRPGRPASCARWPARSAATRSPPIRWPSP